MFGETVIELLKESERNRDTIDQYNDEKVRQIVEEMHVLFKMNIADANETTENKSLWTTVQVRHAALERYKRCLLAYLYSRMNKIKTLRWEFGSVLPPDVRELLSDSEYEWFSRYSTNLASYMRSLGQDIGYSGIDLTENLRPPKSLYIEVLCLTDYGKLELEDGDVILFEEEQQTLFAYFGMPDPYTSGDFKTDIVISIFYFFMIFSGYCSNDVDRVYKTFAPHQSHKLLKYITQEI